MKATSVLSVHSPQATLAEMVARETFQALRVALNNPGCIFTLPGRPLSSRQCCQQIGFTLLDLETSFYTPDLALAVALRQVGALTLIAANAAYLFFPDSTAPQMLESIEEAKIGMMTDPDEGATLIVACGLGEGARLRCSGPGIPQTREMRVEGLPRQFWQVRTAKLRYPLGIDLFLVDDNQVVGLPRTTTVEIG